MSCPISGPWMVLLLVLAPTLPIFAAPQTRTQPVIQHGAIATVHPLATEAGQRVMQQGGNAVDGAIAAAVTLGVVDSHNSGLGGGCLILIRRADGRLLAIDGRETAPAQATRDLFLLNGAIDTRLSQTGPLAVAVPGAVAAYQRALSEAGRKSLAELLLPAADLANDGFPIDTVMARALENSADAIRQFPGTAALLLKPDGQPYQAGERLRQPDLAATYRALAKHGPDWFYRGPFAKEMEEWMTRNGGLITADDLGDYEARIREPIVTSYRGYTIVGFPPPSSGGIHVAQILHLLEPFDLRMLYERDPADLVHVVAEAMKLAFADRAYWLGDSDFVPVPRGLLDPNYARELAKQIDLRQTNDVTQQGWPPNWQTDVFGKHTTHIAAADDEGNWVAITATVNTTFGSKVVIPGTGLVLNNEMDDFSIAPGVPNAFGLIGSEQNAIAGGKRPLSSMSPTIILRDGQPVMTIGAAGGPKIITQVVLGIIRVLDLQQPLSEAVGSPRWHHQWRPNRLLVEESFPAAIRASLQARGHELETAASGGVTQALVRDQAGKFQSVHDPRVPGQARSW